MKEGWESHSEVETYPIKFFYWRNKDDPHNGITFAYKVTKSNVDGTKYYDVSVARCGKHDNFCKKIGRDIATGRLLCGKIRYSFVVPECDHKPTKYLIDRISEDIYGNLSR